MRLRLIQQDCFDVGHYRLKAVRSRDLPENLKPKSGFHNTYARLRSDAPAPAVTSSIGRVSSGRHVHPTQHRALTPREAARLQTFPDSYLWAGGGRWSIYEQIGNAVPPDSPPRVAGPLVNALARLRSTRAAPRTEPGSTAATTLSAASSGSSCSQKRRTVHPCCRSKLFVEDSAHVFLGRFCSSSTRRSAVAAGDGPGYPRQRALSYQHGDPCP